MSFQFQKRSRTSLRRSVCRTEVGGCFTKVQTSTHQELPLYLQSEQYATLKTHESPKTSGTFTKQKRLALHAKEVSVAGLNKQRTTRRGALVL